MSSRLIHKLQPFIFTRNVYLATIILIAAKILYRGINDFCTKAETRVLGMVVNKLIKDLLLILITVSLINPILIVYAKEF